MSTRKGHRTRNTVDKGPVKNVTARSIRRSILAKAQASIDLHSYGNVEIECDPGALNGRYFEDLLREADQQPGVIGTPRPKIRLPFYFVGDGAQRMEVYYNHQRPGVPPDLSICLVLPKKSNEKVLQPEVLVPTIGDQISFSLDSEMTKGFRKGTVTEVTHLGSRHAGRRMALVSFSLTYSK